jgi:hypothetical protein
MLFLSVPLCEATVFLSRTLLYVMTERVCLMICYLCVSLKHLAHDAQLHKVVSVYVNKACVSSS